VQLRYSREIEANASRHVADRENMPSRIPVVEKFTGSALRIERYLGRYRLAAFRMSMRMSQRKSSQRWLKRR